MRGQDHQTDRRRGYAGSPGGWVAAPAVTLTSMGVTAVEGHRFADLDPDGAGHVTKPGRPGDHLGKEHRLVSAGQHESDEQRLPPAPAEAAERWVALLDKTPAIAQRAVRLAQACDADVVDHEPDLPRLEATAGDARPRLDNGQSEALCINCLVDSFIGVDVSLNVFFVLFSILITVLVVVGAVALAVRLYRRPDPAPSEATEAARRHALGVNAAAWTALGALAMLTGITLRGLLQLALGAAMSGVIPFAAGIAFLGVHAIGERTWPRPTGSIRRAALVARSARDVAPVWLHRVTWVWGAALGVALVAMGETAVQGRWFAHSDSLGATYVTWPYPGWGYGISLLVTAAAILAATEGVLRLVARRPAVVDADPDYDAASRRLSAQRVLRGAQLVLSSCLGVVLIIGGDAIVDAQQTQMGHRSSRSGTSSRRPGSSSPSSRPGLRCTRPSRARLGRSRTRKRDDRDPGRGRPDLERATVRADPAPGARTRLSRAPTSRGSPPTIRTLATDLGVAIGTVARAFHELESAGVVVTRRRTGTVVADGASPPDDAVGAAAAAFVAVARSAGLTDDEVLDALRGALLGSGPSSSDDACPVRTATASASRARAAPPRRCPWHGRPRARAP